METIKNKETIKKRALVISGGGSKGAWGGGIAHGLYDLENARWVAYYGTSTGSLLITLVALEDFQKLKKAYTSVNTNNIFSVNPFNKKGKINIWNAIWRLIRRKTSLGEAKKLKKKIKSMFSVREYNKLIENGIKLCCNVTNYKNGKIVYIYNHDYDYCDYVDYTLASSSVPIAFKPLKTDKGIFLDGGVMENIPIQKAIEDGADEIDIIIHSPENYTDSGWRPDNMLDVASRTLELMQRQTAKSDVVIAKLMAQKDIRLNFYYTPRVLTKNVLDFDPVIMSAWWEEGYNSLKFTKEIVKESYLLKRGKGKARKIKSTI